MKKRHRTLKIMAILFLGAMLMASSVSSASAAPRLFGTLGKGGTISTLVELNPATGALVRTIGSVGYAVNGLAYDATTGKLYGATSYNDPSYHGLIEINMTTGAGTAVGTEGWGLCTSDRCAMVCLAANSEGELYAWWEPGEDDLVSIDKNTGIATRIGESDVGTGEQGLAFNNSGSLYLFNYEGDYYTINTGTGASTYIDTVDLEGDLAHHGVFHPTSGLYYGINAAIADVPRFLKLINLSTGTLISTLPTVANLHTLAFLPEGGPQLAIPTFSEWGMIVLSLLLAGLAVFRMRKSGQIPA